MTVLLALLLAAPADAARNVYLDVVVQDDDLRPIHTAVVFAESDDERHRVSKLGLYSSTQRVIEGEYKPLQQGERWTGWVSAPGYALHRIETTLTKPDNRLTVTLERLPQPMLGCVPANHDMQRDHRKLVKWTTDELDRVGYVAAGDPYTERISCLRAVRAIGYASAWQQMAEANPLPIADDKTEDRIFNNYAWSRMHTEEWLEWNRNAGLPTKMAQKWCDSVHIRPCE